MLPAITGLNAWVSWGEVDFNVVGGGSVDAVQDGQGTMGWNDLETISLMNHPAACCGVIHYATLNDCVLGMKNPYLSSIRRYLKKSHWRTRWIRLCAERSA